MGKFTDVIEKHEKEGVPYSPPKADVRQVPAPSAGKRTSSPGQPKVRARKAPSPPEARRTPPRPAEKKRTPAESTPESLSSLIVQNDPYSYESEQFKKIRNSILFPGQDKPVARSVMVTSCLPGEGKTFVATNLAISIAQNINEHVLLIDADVRKPSVHKRFGYGRVRGLSEYLINGIPLSELFLKTSTPKLTILAGGRPPENPAELLSSENMAKLIDEVTRRYSDRYIIIDTPPPKLASETGVIANRVEGVVLVVNAGETPRIMFSELMKTIGKEKVLGVVLNRYTIPLSVYSGEYGKYRRYSKYYRYKTDAIPTDN